MLKTNNGITNINSFPDICQKRQRLKVTFCQSVIEMADKQEAHPSDNKKPVRHVMTLGSASSWTAFNLDLFQVCFDRHNFDPLPDVVLKYTPKDDPAKDDDPEEEKRIKHLRKTAHEVTQSDLIGPRAELNKKIHGNPLFRTFKQLAIILTQQSQETKDREAIRARQARELRTQNRMGEISTEDTAAAEMGISSNVSMPRIPSTIPATPQKRNISDTSFGMRSTETTPTKLTKPETNIQNLQNNIVEDILNCIYDGDIPTPWIRGRTLTLNYTPSLETSFMCSLPDNKTDKFDVVKAIADGALELITDKSSTEKLGNWSKQKACMLFEAKKLDISPEQLESLGETHIKNAESHARAAQILAEMLGLVCHRDYFQYPDQMVFVMNLSGLKVSFYWAEFPKQYLQTIREKNLDELRNIPKIILYHTQPRSLIISDERDQFIKEFLSIIRCLADGYGRIGYLRRDPDSPVHRYIEKMITELD